MGKIRKAENIHNWLYDEEISGKFLMLPPELFEEPAFQALSHAARMFYILLNVHRETDLQRGCLYAALTEYNQIYDLGMTKEEIQSEAAPNKKTKYTYGYFVAPQKHLQMYGYSPAYASKLKKELEAHGFIKIAFGGKGRFNAWNQNVTIYQFVDDWKKLKPT